MAMFLARIKRALNIGTKSITANGTYTASSDGYDGYSSVEVNVSGGTLTDLTPSNASPATITSGTDYHATAGGYAVQTIESKVIQNTPIPIDVGRIYQISTESVYVDGYIINSYSSKTPNDSNPPSVSNNEIVRMGSSGYLYKTQQSGVDISNIIDVATTTLAQSTRKNAIYTVGISVINVKNASTGYSIKFYDSPTASTWFDSVSYSTNKNIDVSNYNVVYFDTASASSVVATVTVKS